MKKLYILLLALPSLVYGQTTYTSHANGDWATPTTWTPNGSPGQLDTVIINNNVTVTTAGQTSCAKLVINSGGVLNNSASAIFVIYNSAINNTGGIWKGSGPLYFGGPQNITILKGGGDFSSQTGNWIFVGVRSTGGPASTMSIDATCNIVKNGGNLYLTTSSWNHAVRILNFGKLTMNAGTVLDGGTLPVSWTQESNSLFWVNSAPLTNSYDTLVASAVGNNVTYESGSTGYTIKMPKGSIYTVLHIHNGTLSLPANNVAVTSLFQIDPNATFNMQGFSMTMGGNWMNNSSAKILNNTGTVTFNGSSVQTMGGTHTTRFTNVTISGTGGVNLATSSAFTGVLTISNTGGLSSSAGINDTLISTSGATGRIAQITGTGTISAKFVVQRYESARGTTGQYAALSTPFGSSETVGDWNTSNQTAPNIFYMSINGGANGLAYNNSTPYYSVYNYVEPNSSTNSAEYVAITNASATIPQGEGIYLWLGTTLSSMSDPFTYIQHGVPNTGTVSIGVTKTPTGQNGVNLLGNPYASPISWSQFQTDNPGLKLQGSYYLMESGGSWVATSSDAIPMCQGFCVFIGSSGAPTSFTALFQEDQKTIGNPLLERVNNNQLNSVTFVLSNQANDHSCPATIVFGPQYNTSYSSTEDAYYIHSGVPGVPILYSVTDNNEPVQLNALPNTSQEIDVPITAIGQVVSTHTITINGLSTLSTYNCVTLTDKSTGEVLNNFEDNPSYSFNIAEVGQEKDFVVKFKQLSPEENCLNSTSSIATINNNLQILPTSTGAIVNFHLAHPEDVIISVYNTMGQKVIQDIKTNVSSNSVAVNLTSGNIYIIRVQDANEVITQKIYH